MSVFHIIIIIIIINIINIRLPHPNWVILSTRLDKPVYLVSEKFLSLAAFTLAQEDFVAKVSYGILAYSPLTYDLSLIGSYVW